MRRVHLAAIAAALSLSLVGCGPEFKQKLDIAIGVYEFATTAEVPADVVIPVANAFDIVKVSAVNYGRYCIKNKHQPAICSADIRRTVVKAVRSGTAARNQLELSIETKQPAAASVYNTLVAAVNGLKASPVNSPQVKEAAK